MNLFKKLCEEVQEKHKMLPDHTKDDLKVWETLCDLIEEELQDIRNTLDTNGIYDL